MPCGFLKKCSLALFDLVPSEQPLVHYASATFWVGNQAPSSVLVPSSKPRTLVASLLLVAMPFAPSSVLLVAGCLFIHSCFQAQFSLGMARAAQENCSGDKVARPSSSP